MKEEIIKEIKKLKYFKDYVDGREYGDFYVTTNKGEEYYVFMNDSKIYILSHYLDKDAKDCIDTPTSKFKEEFINKINQM